MRLQGLLILLTIVLAASSCGWGDDDVSVSAPARVSLEDVLSDKSHSNKWKSNPGIAPDDGCVRLKLRWTGPLKQEFNDSNHVHMEAARELGFPPISSNGDILNLSRPIVKVESCRDFYVEPPTHSFPYLVPEADELLHEIGSRFNDTLQARGGGDYRIKVTSLLRTPATVRKLSRVNRNATSESTHSFGTTFDISYSKFICDNPDATRRTFEDLKNLLGEILHDLREEGRCYVKYEVKQSCFHITTRPYMSYNSADNQPTD